MDFERVLRQLLGLFAEERVSYAVMGAFALGAHGAARATADLDFLVRKDDMPRVHQRLTALGYVRIHHSDDVSQYAGKDAAWGSLDFIHAFRTLAAGMLDRAEQRPVFAGSMSVRVLQAEDVIGLKVQAMVNDPRRRAKEAADIEALLTLKGASLDWGRLAEYYGLFGLGADCEALKGRFGGAR